LKPNHFNDHSKNFIYNAFKILKDHLFDVPIQEGELIIYRLVGVINFMNVKEHIDKIKAFATKEKCTIVISLRYLRLIDIDSITALKFIYDKLSKKIKKINSIKNSDIESNHDVNDKSYKNKIIISGVTKKKILLLNNDEWIENMIKDGALICADKINNNRPSLLI